MQIAVGTLFLSPKVASIISSAFLPSRRTDSHFSSKYVFFSLFPYSVARSILRVPSWLFADQRQHPGAVRPLVFSEGTPELQVTRPQRHMQPQHHAAVVLQGESVLSPERCFDSYLLIVLICLVSGAKALQSLKKKCTFCLFPSSCFAVLGKKESDSDQDEEVETARSFLSGLHKCWCMKC